LGERTRRKVQRESRRKGGRLVEETGREEVGLNVEEEERTPSALVAGKRRACRHGTRTALQG